LGKGVNDRDARQSNFGEDFKSQKSKSAKPKSKPATAVKSENDEENDDDTKSRKSIINEQELQDEINAKLDEEKMLIPESCYINFSKNCRIDKLEGKYLLVAHPFPTFEGELLIV